MRGYLGRERETAEAFTDGWFHTGDLGRLDADGNLYVVDRLKDVIIRGGENIYAAEVEAALYEHPDVTEAAIIGVPDERLGENVGAVVRRPSRTRRSTEDGIRAHVARPAGRVQGARPRVDHRRVAAAQRERQGAQARAARAGAVES